MAGKGDRPRKVNGPKYRDNYDNIRWSRRKSKYFYPTPDLDMLHVDFQHPTDYSGIDDEPIQNQ